MKLKFFIPVIILLIYLWTLLFSFASNKQTMFSVKGAYAPNPEVTLVTPMLPVTLGVTVLQGGPLHAGEVLRCEPTYVVKTRVGNENIQVLTLVCGERTLAVRGLVFE